MEVNMANKILRMLVFDDCVVLTIDNIPWPMAVKDSKKTLACLRSKPVSAQKLFINSDLVK